MSPRADVSEERRTQILDAAEEVFAEKGLDSARMDDIVEESGLSKGALYWYFKSKNDIGIAIMERIFQREFQRFEQLENDGQTAVERLTLFLETSIGDLRRFQRLMPVAFEFVARATRNKTVQRAIREYFNHYMRLLIPIIQSGIDSGEFRSGNAQEMALAIAALFEGTLLLWIYDQSLVDPERHIRSGFDLLIRGILAEPS